MWSYQRISPSSEAKAGEDVVRSLEGRWRSWRPPGNGKRPRLTREALFLRVAYRTIEKARRCEVHCIPVCGGRSHV
jgi:hypothetical protein